MQLAIVSVGVGDIGEAGWEKGKREREDHRLDVSLRGGEGEERKTGKSKGKKRFRKKSIPSRAEGARQGVEEENQDQEGGPGNKSARALLQVLCGHRNSTKMQEVMTRTGVFLPFLVVSF
jgi:hypothetical protein